MKRNPFITAALEELQQDQTNTSETTNGPQVTAPTNEQKTAAATASKVTEVNMDSSTDAVAELMEQNTQLATENDQLQTEVFDNDSDVVDSASDSIQEDLQEAVSAGTALEQLSYLCDLTVKSGQANKASVAGLAFGLEQITDRLGIKSMMPALEAEGGENEEAQAKSIGEKAKNLAITIGKKLMEGIKRIISWVMGFFEQIFTNTKKIAEDARELKKSLGELKPGEIDDDKFVERLRLIDNDKTPQEQYRTYQSVAIKTLFGFFNDKFVNRIIKIFNSLRVNRGGDGGVVFSEIKSCIQIAYDEIFVDKPTGEVKGTEKIKDSKIALTPEVVGGVRLFMAVSETSVAGEANFFKAGVVDVTNLKTTGPIKTISKEDAADLLDNIAKSMDWHRTIEKNFQKIKAMADGPTINYGNFSIQYSHAFLSVLAGFATSIMPHLLLLNVRNSKNFIAYVEKSIAVSKRTAKA